MRFVSRQGSGLHLCLAIFELRGARATLAFTGSLTGLTVGAPFDVTWSGAVGTWTLTLLNGTIVVNKITFGISDESLLWRPYAFTPAGAYVLQLEDNSGQIATASESSILAAGINTSLTPIHCTNNGLGITAGIPFNVRWEGANGTTALSLQEGAANSMRTTDVIFRKLLKPSFHEPKLTHSVKADMKNEYVLWTPYATSTPGQYILRLDDISNDFAYGLVFNMQSAGSESNLSSTSSDSVSESTQTQAPVMQNPSTTSTSSTSKTLGSTVKADRRESSSTSTSTASRFVTSQNRSSTSTSTDSNRAIQTPNTFSSSSNPRNSLSPSPPRKSTFSTAAKAGMGVGCSLAFIFLSTTCLLLYRQWRSSTRDVTEIISVGSSAGRG